MNKFLCLFILLVFCPKVIYAQNSVDFGIKGGLNLTFFKIQEADFGDNIETETGYYGGVFADFKVTDNFSIQPEILYVGLNDFKFVNVPIYTKYEVAHNFYILAGPSINYFFDFFVNKLKIRADISSSYNITEFFDVHIKYVIGFSEIAPNGLFVGAGLKL